MQNEDYTIIVMAEGTDSGWSQMNPFSWPSRVVKNIGEGLIPDYKLKMKLLRQVDNQVERWLRDLGHHVKEMEKALAANRFTTLTTLLAEINHKLKSAVEAGRGLEDLEQEALREFDEAGSLPNDLEQKLAQAGWWSDKKREWVARRFENENREKRQLALTNLVDITRQTVLEVKEELHLMGQARATGKIGLYIESLKKISAIQKNFYAQFKPIYDLYLAPIVKRLQEKRLQQQKNVATPTEIPALPAETVTTSVPVQEQVLPSIPSLIPGKDFTVEETPQTEDAPHTESLSAPTNSAIPSVEVPISYDTLPQSGDRPTLPSLEVLSPEPVVPSQPVIPEVKPAVKNKAKSLPRTKPRTKKQKAASPVETAWLKKVNAQFYSDLNKAATENNPYLLGWMMVKHAELIADIDQDQSAELVEAAENILNE